MRLFTRQTNQFPEWAVPAPLMAITVAARMMASSRSRSASPWQRLNHPASRSTAAVRCGNSGTSAVAVSTMVDGRPA